MLGSYVHPDLPEFSDEVVFSSAYLLSPWYRGPLHLAGLCALPPISAVSLVAPWHRDKSLAAAVNFLKAFPLFSFLVVSKLRNLGVKSGEFCVLN